jgi:transcriptional antiterminator RfaH
VTEAGRDAMMLRWYLIRTKPSSEGVAQSSLSRQGYEVYLPRVVEPVLRRGVWGERITALFPRYLFLRLKEGIQALAPVSYSVGVADAVRFGSRYGVVPDEIVRDLRARADSITGLHRIVGQAPLHPGMTVKIATGPFNGLEGVFERAAGADRVVVLLELLGQQARVKVPTASIGPVLRPFALPRAAMA